MPADLQPADDVSNRPMIAIVLTAGISNVDNEVTDDITDVANVTDRQCRHLHYEIAAPTAVVL